MTPQNENREGHGVTPGSRYQSDFMRLCHIPWFLRATMGALRVFTCIAFNSPPRLNLSADWLARGLFRTPRNESPNSLSCLCHSLKMHSNCFNIGIYFPSSKDRKDPSITSGMRWSGPLASSPLNGLQRTARGRQKMNETNETEKLLQSTTVQYRTRHKKRHNSYRNYGAQQSCGGLFARYSFEDF